MLLQVTQLTIIPLGWHVHPVTLTGRYTTGIYNKAGIGKHIRRWAITAPPCLKMTHPKYLLIFLLVWSTLASFNTPLHTWWVKRLDWRMVIPGTMSLTWHKSLLAWTLKDTIALWIRLLLTGWITCSPASDVASMLWGRYWLGGAERTLVPTYPNQYFLQCQSQCPHAALPCISQSRPAQRQNKEGSGLGEHFWLGAGWVVSPKAKS